MTEIEAIKEIRFNMSTIGLSNEAAKRVVEARDMAINALEKQIPNSKISEYQKLRHKMNKIEDLLDNCTAFPDDMCNCLIQIEKVVKE